MRGRDARFRRLIADASAAIERGDLERARVILLEVPSGRSREAARLIATHTSVSPDRPDMRPELLFDLLEQAKSAATSRINDYGQGPLPTPRSPLKA
jgi:hypothetical protein